LNVFFIGNGNVAQHLATAITATEHSVIGHYARSEKSFPSLSTHYKQYNDIPSDADIYIICVSDDAIEEVCNSLPSSIKSQRIIVHTSGAKSIKSTLPNVSYPGVFYPLQTFTAGRGMAYDQIPLCINALEDDTMSNLRQLAESISNTVVQVDDHKRKQVHLSAVMINNFVNHLIARSEQLLASEDIDPSILQPLLIETIEKQADIGSDDAQTGPARRGDQETIKAHLELLHKKSDKKMYKAISKSITKNYNK